MSTPNRAERIRLVALWEAVAEKAREYAQAERDELQREALEELKTKGTQPSWPIRGFGSASLPLSNDRAVVTEPVAFLAWVKARRPTEVVEQVRPAYFKAIAKRLRAVEDLVCLADDGEAVPGVAIVPGGQPGSLSIRVDAEAKAQLAGEADDMLAAVAAALAEPVGQEPTP